MSSQIELPDVLQLFDTVFQDAPSEEGSTLIISKENVSRLRDAVVRAQADARQLKEELDTETAREVAAHKKCCLLQSYLINEIRNRPSLGLDINTVYDKKRKAEEEENAVEGPTTSSARISSFSSPESARSKGTPTSAACGKYVDKYIARVFDDDTFYGLVIKADDSRGCFVVYQDGDSQYLTPEETKECVVDDSEVATSVASKIKYHVKKGTYKTREQLPSA